MREASLNLGIAGLTPPVRLIVEPEFRGCRYAMGRAWGNPGVAMTRKRAGSKSFMATGASPH